MPKRKDNMQGDLPQPADEHDRKLLADVNEHGWHVIGVMESREGPAFAYSIGLYRSFSHPELILIGLPVPVMHKIINVAGEKTRSGECFEHLAEDDDILQGYSVSFRTFARRHYREYLGFARWFYQGDEFPVLQCVWPDSQHHYPWHPQAQPAFAERQPVLSDDTSWPFHEGANRAVFTTRPVLESGHPILLVTHGQDGDWQFLCGTTNRSEDGRVVSLGAILERDPTLAEVANLPEGFRAQRRQQGARWKRERLA
jgi:hypothetical protein